MRSFVICSCSCSCFTALFKSCPMSIWDFRDDLESY